MENLNLFTDYKDKVFSIAGTSSSSAISCIDNTDCPDQQCCFQSDPNDIFSYYCVPCDSISSSSSIASSSSSNSSSSSVNNSSSSSISGSSSSTLQECETTSDCPSGYCCYEETGIGEGFGFFYCYPCISSSSTSSSSILSDCYKTINAITNIELDSDQNSLIYDVYSVKVNSIITVFDNPIEITTLSTCSLGSLPINTNQNNLLYVTGGCDPLVSGVVDEVVVDLYIENNVLYYKKLLVELIEAINNSTKIISQIDNNCYPYYCKNGSCVNDGQHQVSDTTYAFFGQCIGDCTPLSSSSSSVESYNSSSSSSSRVPPKCDEPCTTNGLFWCERTSIETELGTLYGCQCINSKPVPPGRCSYASVAECQPHCFQIPSYDAEASGGECLCTSEKTK